MPLSRYLKIFPAQDKTDTFVVYSTRKGSLVKVSAALLAAAREDRLSERDRRTLARLQIITDDPAAEKEEMRGMIDRTQRNPRFKALVVLNLDCNLACPYCYEDPFRGNHYMSQDTADMLVEKIRDHIRKGQEVTIDFYGGEALLSKTLLINIAAALHREAGRCGTTFTFGMITNGTLLTRETVTELKSLGFTDAKITLDGPKEIHDQQRRFTSGKGSFDVIVRNVQQTWDLINICLGGNYSPHNYRRYPLLLDYLLEQDLTPEKLGVIQFAPIMPKANSAKARFAAGCGSKETWIAEASVFLREETMRRGFAVHKPTMAACMVDFPQQFVVNYDGSLFKCPAFIGWPELSIGTIYDGIRDYSETHGVNLWKRQECLDCPYLPICFGGCRFLTLLKKGVIDEVDCRREFYDATLEQTIRQDLHYSVKSSAKHNS